MTQNAATLYGIANCDTVKKTRKLLDALGVDYAFHDYKKAGLDAALAETLLGAISLEVLINKRGTTWRKLTAAQQDDLDLRRAPQLIMANPSLVRRPIIRHGNDWIVGFDEAQLRALAQ
jgi:arsenate reductase